jgi:GPH family glycoside/pentoside/hexuronide:cation symporter
VGDTACCLFWVIVSSYLNLFYTDIFGLAPSALAWLLLITRIWDAAFDPVMGMIADRTRSRWGKFRPWLLWGILPFMAAEVALFHTPDLGPGGKLVYAYVTYSLMMLIYSMLNVPYGALLGVITADSTERTTLASYRFVGAFVGNFIVQGCLLYLVQRLGGGNDRVGYPLAVGVLALLSGLLFLYLFASTRERVRPPVERSSVRRDLRDLLGNRPWLILFGVGALSLVYVTMRQVAAVYYISYYVGDRTLIAKFLLAGTVFSIAGAVLAPWFARLVGCKKRAFLILTLLGLACNGATWFAGPGDLWIIFGSHILGSVPLAAIFPLMGSMFADTADYGQWKFGRRATGLVFAGSTFSQKTGGAIGAALVNVVLYYSGYVANAVQGPSSLLGLRHVMSTLPALGGLLVLGLASLYPLNEAEGRRIAAALQASAAGTAEGQGDSAS